MTPQLRETFEGKRLKTQTKGVWRIELDNSAPHQGGVNLKLIPEQEKLRHLLMQLFVDDEDEQYVSEIDDAVIEWIEAEPKLSQVVMFDRSQGALVSFRRHRAVEE